jgi:hypothetical protein
LLSMAAMEFRPSPSSARLFLNSMLSDSFISGLQALSEHWNYLSFFGDAAQFERRKFDLSSPHKSEGFAA